MLYFSKGSNYARHTVIGPNRSECLFTTSSENFSMALPIYIPFEEEDTVGQLQKAAPWRVSQMFQGNKWDKCEGDRSCFHSHIDGIIQSRVDEDKNGVHLGFFNATGEYTCSNTEFILPGWSAKFMYPHRKTYAYGYCNLAVEYRALLVSSSAGGNFPAMVILQHASTTDEVSLIVKEQYTHVYCYSYKNCAGTGQLQSQMWPYVCENRDIAAAAQWALSNVPSKFAYFVTRASFNTKPQYGLQTIEYGQKSVSLPYVYKLRQSLFALYSANLEHDRSELFGNACIEAIQGARPLDINTIAYFADFRSLFGEFKDMLYVYKHPTSPKAWAKMFLGAKYGTQLTLADTQELADALRACRPLAKSVLHPYATCRARKTDSFFVLPSVACARQVNYKVYYQPYNNAIMKKIKFLMDWDIWPSLQNLWDFVPLSFVVDWFFNVEELLVVADTATYLEYLDIYGVTSSCVDIVDWTTFLNKNEPNLEHVGLTLTVYDRRVKPFLDLPIPSFGPQDQWANHVFELTAIAVTGSKRHR